MSLVIVLLIVPYALVGLCISRLVAGHLAWWQWYSKKSENLQLKQIAPNSDQWFAAWCGGLLAGIFWPIVSFTFFISKYKDKYAVGAEARALIEKREKRIEELEKELKLEGKS